MNPKDEFVCFLSRHHSYLWSSRTTTAIMFRSKSFGNPEFEYIYMAANGCVKRFVVFIDIHKTACAFYVCFGAELLKLQFANPKD